MVRVLVAILVVCFALSPARSQQIDTSLSDKQIVSKILGECRELYMRSVGACACADARTRNSAQCAKVLKELPERFNPFCTRKDVTLNEVRLYRMQNEGFIDRRCSR